MAKIIPPLTQQAIRNAQRHVASSISETNARVELRDGACPGLVLRVGRTGAVWSLILQRPSQRLRIPLGGYPAVGIPAARIRAAHARDDAGRYPGALAAPVAQSDLVEAFRRRDTFERVIGLFSYSSGRTQSWADGERRVRSVFHKLLSVPANTITTQELQRLVDAHPSRSSAAAAVRYVRPLLRWARKRGYVRHDLDERDLEPPSFVSTRERVLSDVELRAVLKTLTYEGYDAAARFVLATGARKGEVCGAVWGEVNLEKREWAIPGERRKNGRALVVPLSAYAIDVIEGVVLARAGEGAQTSNDVMFQGVRGAGLSNWDRWQKEFFKRSGTSGWHRHDLRRTVATVAGNLGAAPHIVEIILGHADPHSSLASVYNKSRYLPEHLEVLERVGEYLRSIGG